MMRYKTMVTKDLELTESLLKAVQKGLNNSTITPVDAYNKVSEALIRLENAMEKVRLEPDQHT